MIATIVTHVIAAVIGAVVGIFFYRNNTKDVSKIADKVDKVWDDAKEKLD
jgi:tetrahydromethanopterin S-methyltransferase subunit C